MSELSKLRNALRKLSSKESKLLKLMGSDGGDTLKNEKKLLDIRSRKKETIGDIAQIEYEQSEKKEKDRKKPTESKKQKLKTLSLRGRGGGGAMIDLTRRTGKSLLQSEFRKKL